MKLFALLIAGVLLGFGGAYLLFTNNGPEVGSGTAGESGSTGRDRFGNTTGRTLGTEGDGSKIPTFPGLRGKPQPFAMNSNMPRLFFSEFAEEMGLSESKAEELYQVLTESDQMVISLGRVDEAGVPIMPSKEELENIRTQREENLTKVLGADGFENFKAYTTSLPGRKVLNALERSGSGIPLDPEQKKAVLYEAVKGISVKNSTSKEAYLEEVTAAILDKSSKYLSEGDQKRLAEAMEAEKKRRTQKLGPRRPQRP